MDRRRFISDIALACVAMPFAAEAQRPAKVARIGFLVFGSLDSPETRPIIDSLRQGLRERGYVEGQNIVIEVRAANGRAERLPGLATELVALKADTIVSVSEPASRAAQQATSTVPMVAPAMVDPVGDGLVASLSRPGGNITGLTFLGPDLVPKRLALLKETLPKASRVAALWHRGAFAERTTRDMLTEAEAAARTLGLQLQLVEVQSADEIDRAFSMMTAERANAVILFPSSMLFNERRRIVELSTGHRLPSMFVTKEFVELGGLISYGASINDLVRRGATYVDKILNGANPADLPVEQPINLKTAKALGLTIPQSMLLRADEVIQ